MRLGLNLGMKIPRGFTLQGLAQAILKSFGSNASEYPFATRQGMYQTSAGPASAAVNNPIGLELDSLGTVGVELVVNGDFSGGATGWGLGSGWTVSGGAANAATAGVSSLTQDLLVIEAGKTYLVMFTAVVTSGNISAFLGGASVKSNFSTGTYSIYVQAGGATTLAFDTLNACVCSIDNVSCKEVTGNHATQTTAGNRPLLQRGTWNLLKWSTDFSNAVWNKTAPPQDEAFQIVSGLPAGTKVTISCKLSGSGTIQIGFFGATLGALDDTITLTATPTRYSKTITTVAAEDLYAYPYASRGVSTATGFVASEPQLEYGQVFTSYTPTTSAAGSNPTAGNYWAQFNGANQSLQLTSVPFQMADDFAVVACVNVGTPTNWTTVFSVSGAGATSRIELFIDNASGHAAAYFRDDASANTLIQGAADVRNVLSVLTIAKRGTAVFLRVNGVQVATGSVAALGTATMTSSSIGIIGASSEPLIGALYYLDPIKGAVTDAQLLVLEKAAAQRGGITI